MGASSYLDDASNEVESEWVPAAASVNVDEDEAALDEFGAKDFRSQMILRDDHEVGGCVTYNLKELL